MLQGRRQEQSHMNLDPVNIMGRGLPELRLESGHRPGTANSSLLLGKMAQSFRTPACASVITRFLASSVLVNAV
jgi:hypothetical protein